MELRTERAKGVRRGPFGRVVEAAVADDDDGSGVLVRRAREGAERRGEVAPAGLARPTGGACRWRTHRRRSRADEGRRRRTRGRAGARRGRSSRAKPAPCRVRRGARAPLSPGSAIERDVSASTTTRAPTTLSRAAIFTGLRTAKRSAATATTPVPTMRAPPRSRLRISTRRRAKLASASAHASTTAHIGRSDVGAKRVVGMRGGGLRGWLIGRCGGERALPHEEGGVDLVVLVVRAEDVHRDVHREADRVLALDVAPGDDRSLPEARSPGERAAEVVRGEDDLRRAAADDGIERLGPRTRPSARCRR